MINNKQIKVKRENVAEAISNEQLSFISFILLSSGIQKNKLKECIGDTVEHRIALRDLCRSEKIEILLNYRDGLVIMVQGSKVAEWFEPVEVWNSKEQLIQLDTSWWSVFDKE